MLRLLVLLAFLLAGAAPASAHDVAEHGAPGIASDVRSVVVSSSLPPGVTVQVLQNGQALRLVNASPRPVTVRGQEFRVEPGTAAQWHEDAAHPSGAVGTARPVRDWEVTVVANGVPHVVTGELRWVAGPAPWPWLAIAALPVVLALRWPAVALMTATASSVAVAALAFAARTGEGPRAALLGSYLPQAGCWAMALLSVVLVARGRRDGGALGVLAAAALVLLTVVGSAPALWSSTVVAAGPDRLVRALVALALGAAAGSVVALALRARSDARTAPEAPHR